MNTPPVVTQSVKLPEPNYPMVTRLLTKQFFHDAGKKVVACPHCKGQISIDQPAGNDEPVHWVVGEPHPLVPNARVVRMFVEDAAVEVYSISTDGKAGMRNIVPMSHVTLVEEAMTTEIFIEELNEAENAGSEPEVEVLAPAPNGQQSVS